MSLDPNDLLIEVGFKAYEKWTGKKILDCQIRKRYLAAVFIAHIPTNLSSYSNYFENQQKNKEKALQTLSKYLREIDEMHWREIIARNTNTKSKD